jgi:hypothetical protein
MKLQEMQYCSASLLSAKTKIPTKIITQLLRQNSCHAITTQHKSILYDTDQAVSIFNTSLNIINNKVNRKNNPKYNPFKQY